MRSHPAALRHAWASRLGFSYGPRILEEYGIFVLTSGLPMPPSHGKRANNKQTKLHKTQTTMAVTPPKGASRVGFWKRWGGLACFSVTGEDAA